MKTRRFTVLDPQGRCSISQEPVPAVGPGQVLINVKATMISAGTQLTGVREARAGSAPLPAPRRLGYQAAGQIVALGAGVTQLQPGQRIACLGGAAMHADWIVVPQNLCAVLPEKVTYEQASGMNLVLTAVHALRRTEPQLGEFMLVVGLGVVGQLSAQVAKASGMYVMGWDTLPLRVEIARRHSADAALDPRADTTRAQCKEFTQNIGFDAALMATGGDCTAILEQVTKVMKLSPDGHEMGRVVLVSGKTTCSWGAAMGNIDLRCSSRTGPGYHDEAWELGQSHYPPVFMRWTTTTNMQTALRMIGDGRINIDSLVTHRLPLDRAAEAVDLLIDQPDKTLGVVLTVD